MDYWIVNDRYNISNLPLSHFDRIVTPIYAYSDIRFNLSFPDDVSEFFSRYPDIEKLVTHEFSGTPLYEIKPEQVLSLAKDGHILQIKPNTSWHITNAFIVIDGKLKDNVYTFSDFYNKELFHTAFSQKISRGLKVKDTFVPGYVPEDPRLKVKNPILKNLEKSLNNPTKATNESIYGKPIKELECQDITGDGNIIKTTDINGVCEQIEDIIVTPDKNKSIFDKVKNAYGYVDKKTKGIGKVIEEYAGENVANATGGALNAITMGALNWGNESSKVFKAADWLTPLPYSKGAKVFTLGKEAKGLIKFFKRGKRVKLAPGEAGRLRRTPGVGTGTGKKIFNYDKWRKQFDTKEGAPIPSQIADKIRGKQYSSSNAMTKDIWKEIAKDPKTSNVIGKENVDRILLDKKSPLVPNKFKVGKRVGYEIDHTIDIQYGGKVYDVNNMNIKNPLNHIYKEKPWRIDEILKGKNIK